MKYPALYLRISDKIIAVSGEQKPLESTVRFTTTYESDLQAFNDSFIEVSNKDILLQMWSEISGSEQDFLKFGTYPAPEGLEFEVKEEKYMTNPPRLTGHKVAVVSLSSPPDTVEPTANEGEKDEYQVMDLLKLQMLQNALEEFDIQVKWNGNIWIVVMPENEAVEDCIKAVIRLAGIKYYGNEQAQTILGEVMEELETLKTKSI